MWPGWGGGWLGGIARFHCKGITRVNSRDATIQIAHGSINILVFNHSFQFSSTLLFLNAIKKRKK